MKVLQHALFGGGVFPGRRIIGRKGDGIFQRRKRGKAFRAGDDFARLDARQLAGNLRHAAGDFHRHAFAGGNVGVGKPGLRAVDNDGQQEVVLFFIEHRLIDDRAGRDHADHAAFHQRARLLRVGQLLADGDLIALIDQPADIRLRRVIRDAAHGRALFQAAVASGQHQLQFARARLRVLEEHLIKIADSVKQQRVRKFFFHGQILPHHRGQGHSGASFSSVETNSPLSVLCPAAVTRTRANEPISASPPSKLTVILRVHLPAT